MGFRSERFKGDEMTKAFNLDCMEAMRNMPDNAFDLAIVDPVYGGVTKGGYMENRADSKDKRGNFVKPRHYHLALWGQEKTGADYFRELFRVSKNQVIWGGKLLYNGNREEYAMLVDLE